MTTDLRCFYAHRTRKINSFKYKNTSQNGSIFMDHVHYVQDLNILQVVEIV